MSEPDRNWLMDRDKYKWQFASILAIAFQNRYVEQLADQSLSQEFSAEHIYNNLDKPKDPKMGRFAFPVFRFSKVLKIAPPIIAKSVVEYIKEKDELTSTLVQIEAMGGFINCHVNMKSLIVETLNAVLSQSSEYGNSTIGDGKRVIVEYSSVNIAKPFGIGHLRTTILGNSLRLLYKKCGYDVVGINYLGDWGTQFGKMIVAFRKWGGDIDLSQNAVAQLLELYVRFHKEAELDEALNEEARRVFKALEDGESEAVALWQRFREISIDEFKRIYELLGVEFDLITGESFLNDKMDSLIERLEKANLTSESQGALIVELDDPLLPPCLLKKADGATLYATRDIAGALWRYGEYRFDKSLYVVAVSQSDHFKQVFKVIELLEEAEKIPESERIAPRLEHTDFGWVKFGDKTMSTRSGTIIFLEDVINKAIHLVHDMITEKNPKLPELEKTAQAVGVGAVLFSQLSVRRQTDVNFDWDAVLSFEGETGPYLQYTHARLCSLIRKYNQDISPDIDFSVLDREEEHRVIELLYDFPVTIESAVQQDEPFFVSSYLLSLSSAFNRVYQRKDESGGPDRIISDDTSKSSARMALVQAVRIVIGEGLRLLGIQAPEEM